MGSGAESNKTAEFIKRFDVEWEEVCYRLFRSCKDLSRIRINGNYSKEVNVKGRFDEKIWERKTRSDAESEDA